MNEIVKPVVRALPGERSSGINVNISHELQKKIWKEVDIAADAARDSMAVFVVPALELAKNTAVMVGAVGEFLSRPLKSRMGRTSTLLTLVAAQLACGFFADRNVAIPTPKPKETPVPQAAKVETPVVVTPTVDVDPNTRSEVTFEPLAEAKLLNTSREFSKSKLVFQTALQTEDGGISVNEYSLPNPGEDARYSCVAAFQWKGKDGKVLDTICAIRGMLGEEFFALRSVNNETGEVKYIQMQEANAPVYIDGFEDPFRSYIYWELDDDGNANYQIPMSLQYNSNGYTGKMVYGIDEESFEVIELKQCFSVKDALLAPQLLSLFETVEKKMQEDGIDAYNLGFDFKTGEMKVYGEGGVELGTIEGNTVKWNEEDEAAKTVTIGGVTMNVDENGVVDMASMKVEGKYTDAQKAEKLAVVDPKAWGCEDCTIIKDKTGTHIVAEGQNVAIWTGTAWKWSWEVMENLEGGNPLFKFAKTVEMNGKSPVDMTSARSLSGAIYDFANDVGNLFPPGTKNIQPIFLFNGSDKSKSIIGYSITNLEDKVMGTHNKDSDAEADAIVCIMTKSGKIISISIEKARLVRRTFN